MFPMFDVLDKIEINNIDNLENLFRNIIHTYIHSHTMSKKAHEELMAMSHLDEDISNIFKTSEFELTNRIVEFLNSNNISIENPFEKIHIIIALVENLCHEVVYHKHDKVDYEIMENEVININIKMIK